MKINTMNTPSYDILFIMLDSNNKPHEDSGFVKFHKPNPDKDLKLCMDNSIKEKNTAFFVTNNVSLMSEIYFLDIKIIC